MPRASKFKLKEKEFEEIQEHFFHLVSSLDNQNKVRNFFNEFLTAEEKIMLAKRTVLYILIKKGYSPSFIQDLLHVSYETVRSHKVKYARTGKEFQDNLNKLLMREKTKEFFSKLERLMKPFDQALRAKNDMKARAKLISSAIDDH